MTAPVITRPTNRAAWFSARARNAGRRGMLVSVIGGLAVITTFLLLVLVPREVDRAVRNQLSALAPMRDTTALLNVVRQREALHEQAEAALRSARRADSALVATLARAAAVDSSALTSSTTAANPLPPTEPRSTVARDAESADLLQRLNRARAAPLLESYRELAQNTLMRADSRVRPILDSLEQVDREREAFAALGGPDARYAALSARMGTLGQRLVRVAESNISRVTGSDSMSVTPANPDSLSATVATARRRPEELLALTTAAADAQREVDRARKDFDDARKFNESLVAQRKAITGRTNLTIPQSAMLLAAIVLGIAVGYAGALLVELRTPRVADAVEAERIAGARVIVHGGTSADRNSARTRRRADRALPPALDADNEAYHLLHFTLTGVGDVARRVRVISDAPVLAAKIAANLAASVAREARAVLLIDLDLKRRLIASLLRVDDRRGIGEVLAGNSEVLEVLRDFAVGRDVYMTVLYGGTRGAKPTVERRTVVHEDLDRLALRYDLTVVVCEETAPAADRVFDTTDAIICARLGVTSIEWLEGAAQHVRDQGHRVRAVLLWTGDARVG